MVLTLLTIPLKDLTGIVRALDDVRDFANLRLACRELDAKLKAEFAEVAFGDRKFVRSTSSLNLLTSISRHPFFRHHLHTFRIGPDVLPELPWEIVARLTPSDAPTAASAHKAALMKQRYDEQTELLGTLSHDILVSAFQRLPNLKNIVVEKFDSFGVTNSLVEDWGIPVVHVFGNLGDPQGNEVRLPDFWSHWAPERHTAECLQLVMSALGRSGARPTMIRAENGWVPPDRIQDFVRLVRMGVQTARLVSTFPVSVPAPLTSLSAAPSLSQLKEVQLDFLFDAHQWRTSRTGPGNTPFDLRRYLCSAPGLERLLLERYVGSDEDELFLEWLAGDVHSASNGGAFDLPSPALKHLEYLDMDACAFDEDANVHLHDSPLHRLLRKVSRTLKRLRMTHGLNASPDFLDFVADTCVKLEEISFVQGKILGRNFVSCGRETYLGGPTLHRDLKAESWWIRCSCKPPFFPSSG